MIKKLRERRNFNFYYKSFLRYPLNLYSGHDCAILDGFGPKICDFLEEKLQQHLAKLSDVEMKNLCFKDKLTLLQKKELDELQDFIRDIEASQLTDDSLADKTVKSLKDRTNLENIAEEDEDMEQFSSQPSQVYLSPIKEDSPDIQCISPVQQLGNFILTSKLFSKKLKILNISLQTN